MSSSSYTDMNYTPYDIARISSYDKTHISTHSSVMSIGKNCRGYKSRVLIKFNFNHLPKNVRILRAILVVNVINCTTNQLLGYTLNSDWNIHTVNWNNQPSINFRNELLKKSICNCKKYYFDITNQARIWHEHSSSNYGMILSGSEMSCFNKIQICTEQGSSNNLSLLVEYFVEQDIHIKTTQFFEYIEDIQISTADEVFTTGRNISLMQTVAYFIKNNSKSDSITVIAENSPDNVNYAKEIQTIIIPPEASSLLVPINFSKYIRLSITLPNGGNLTTINTWLNLQT